MPTDRSKPTRRAAMASLAAATVAGAQNVRRDTMREVPPNRIVTVRGEADWYMHSVGIEAVGKNELVCTYRRTDEHIASVSDIWCCRSTDGGVTWTDHRMISASSFAKDKACWVAPQLGKTKAGKLLLLCDRGNKLAPFDWPMLSQWQQPPRGMSNHLFTSTDKGRTWTGPVQTDNVGGEPGYIIELSSGDLMYTRTDSRPTTAKKVPSMPWGANYYRNTAVFSKDGGKSWNETAPIFDDPLVGDCEVGVCEYARGKVLAISRIGDAGSALGQPSRMALSNDFGRTWSKPQLLPIYAHRPIVKMLQSGKLMVSYRNAWGTPGSCVFSFRPGERMEYQPNSFLWEDAVCRLHRDHLELRTTEGTAGACEFTLYPVEDDESKVTFEAELLVREADQNGCLIAAGAYLRFLPGRVEIADRPADGFAVKPGEWHKYKIVNHGPRLEVFADGEKKLDVATAGIHTRLVRFGNRPRQTRRSGNAEGAANTEKRPLASQLYTGNASHSLWRSVRVEVANRRDHSIRWAWTPAQGYPDQFRRDRVVRLEKNGSFSLGNSGYSSWTQLPNGQIVVADYSSMNPPQPHPVLRAYRLEAEP